MSKYIDLAKKLKALADRGIGGEKINAERMLNDFMKKHKISMDEIEGETIDHHFFKIKKEDYKLWIQVCAKVCRDITIYGPFPAKGIKEYQLPGNYSIKVTLSQYIEIECMYSFYKNAYKKELDIFYLAFLKKNDLLVDGDGSEPKMSKENIDKYKKAYMMSMSMEKHTFRKQIQNGN